MAVKAHPWTRTVAVVIAAVLALVAFPALADARPWTKVDTAVDRGQFLSVFVSSGIFDNPKKFRLEVRNPKNKRVEVDWDNLCSKGFSTKSQSDTFKRFPRFRKQFRPTIKRPDYCWLTISISTADFDARGKLKAVLYAKQL